MLTCAEECVGLFLTYDSLTYFPLAREPQQKASAQQRKYQKRFLKFHSRLLNGLGLQGTKDSFGINLESP
jgi:hypothetical protein